MSKMEERNHPVCGEPTRHRFSAIWLSRNWPAFVFRVRGYLQNNRILLKMENSDGSQRQNPSGECSLTPLLFEDRPRDAEPVPKVLVDMFENGAKFSRVPEFTWSVEKDAKSAKLRKELCFFLRGHCRFFSGDSGWF